jgi:hypothetical protein
MNGGRRAARFIVYTVIHNEIGSAEFDPISSMPFLRRTLDPSQWQTCNTQRKSVGQCLSIC